MRYTTAHNFRFRKASRITRAILAFGLATLMLLGNSFLTPPVQIAEATWYDTDWQFRQKFTITNPGLARGDYGATISEELISRWNFEAGSGTTAADVSGYSNDASIVGLNEGVAWSTSGKYGGGIAFSGDTDTYIDVGTNEEYLENNLFSISLWFKSASSSQMKLLSKGFSSYGNGYMLELNGGELIFGVGGGSESASVQLTTSTSGSFDDDAWHHAMVVFDEINGLVTIYADGAAASIAKVGSTCGTISGTDLDISSCTVNMGPNATGDLVMGRLDSGASQAFSGLLDEVRVFNRAFSSTEVDYLYDNNISPLLGSHLYSNCEEDGKDIYITAADGSTAITFYISKFTASGQQANILARVDLAASSTLDIYIYYGYASATSSSNASAFVLVPSYSVNGAGTPSYDGNYIENGTYNGEPAYESSTGNWIYWNNNMGEPFWSINYELIDDTHSYFTNSATLPGTTWYTGPDADSPAPTVTLNAGELNIERDANTPTVAINGTYESAPRPDPTLVFTVEGVASSETHNGVTTNISTTYDNIAFGKLEMNTPKYGAHKLTVSMNALSGYTVSVKMDGYIQGFYPANKLDPFGATNVSWTTPQYWSSPNGTQSNTDTGWVGANTSDTRVTGWSDASGKFGPISSTAHTVMAGADENSSTTIYVSYAIETNPYQPIDSYAGSIFYNIIPTY